MNPPTVPPPLDLAAAIRSEGMTHRLRVPLILGAVTCLLGAGGWYWWWRVHQARTRASAYITEPLKRGDLNLSITATGNLAPTTEVTVGSELSGTTLEVYVEFNDRVTKGKPLAKLDTSRLTQQTESSRAALNSAQAMVGQAEATVRESSATLKRQQELSGLSLIPDADLETAVATADRAQASLQSAKALVGEAAAQVRINENDLTKAIIKSPIDGIVLTRSLEPGQTVAASFTAPQLFVIAEKLERMKLEISIAEADIGRVSRGQTAVFTVDAWPDRNYSAVVSVVSFGSVVKDNVVTYEADLEVSNDDLSLRPGMTATADILVAAATNVFLVPTAALRFHPATNQGVRAATKKSFVQSLIPMPTRNSRRPAESASPEKPERSHLWILREGQIESMPVQLGLTDGRSSEVSGEGLSEGLQVVLRANAPAP